MSDYISRKAAVDALTKVALRVADSKRRTVATCINEIELLPAADVALVRRVTPIRCGMDEYYGEWVRCPNCDFDLNTSAAKFCGGCGAKMSLEEKDNER